MKGTRGGVTGGNEGAPHCRTKDDTMLKRIGLLTAVGVLCVSWAGAAQALCVVDTSTPTYDNGKFLRYTPCNENGAIKTTGAGGGGAVSTLAIASGVTTNTSTTPVAGVSGTKNFQWVVIGTGAVTQTVVLKGSFDSDGSYPTYLCTITISGTAPAHDVCPPFTAPFPYLFVTTTGTTGTSASGTGKVGY